MAPGPNVATIGEEAPSCAGSVEGSNGVSECWRFRFLSPPELAQAGRGKSRDLLGEPQGCRASYVLGIGATRRTGNQLPFPQDSEDVAKHVSCRSCLRIAFRPSN
jgi:hypothetical protein